MSDAVHFILWPQVNFKKKNHGSKVWHRGESRFLLASLQAGLRKCMLVCVQVARLQAVATSAGLTLRSTSVCVSPLQSPDCWERVPRIRVTQGQSCGHSALSQPTSITAGSHTSLSLAEGLSQFIRISWKTLSL